MTETAEALGRQSAWWQRSWMLGLMILACGMPLIVPSFPPLIDLPAHFSAYYVQDSLSHSSSLQHFYVFGWKFIPNLGVEVVTTALTPLLGLTLAVRVTIAALPVTMAIGMVWTAREVHRRVPATVMFALPLTLSYPLIFGFVNYWMSIAMAFVATGGWLMLTRRRQVAARTVAFMLVAPCILIVHVLGYGVFGLIAGGSLLAAERASSTPWKTAIWRTLLSCAPMAWPLPFLFLWQDATSPSSGGWLDLSSKAIGFVTVLRDQVRWWDLLSAAIVYGIAALPLLVRKRFRYAPMLALPALLMWVLTVILPTNVFGSDFASVRLVPVALTLTVLAISPAAPLSWRWLVAGLLFVSARILLTTVHMVAADHAITRQLQALAYVAPGSRVTSFYVFPCDRRWEPPRFQHIGSFATSRRAALSNDQFVRKEGHLLGIKPDVGALAPSVVSRTPCSRWRTPLLRDELAQVSSRNADYVWIIASDDMVTQTPPSLSRRWSYLGSALYRVTPSPAQRSRGEDTSPPRR